jgi:hypothetical protein
MLPKCGGDMRVIACSNEVPVSREILGHLGEATSAPRLAPTRGPPLWELPATEQAGRETNPQPQPPPADGGQPSMKLAKRPDG